MAEIGIVVCNYNKKEDVLKCIESIFMQTMQDFDVYVVDNASEDGSVHALQSAYSDRINIIVNPQNLGGSGGFNAGLRKVLENDYKYLMCVDNDVYFDKDAIGSLYRYLEEHEDVGVAGSLVYYMDTPKRIWSFGGEINPERCVQVDHYRNYIDDGGIPDEMDCTWVPACSLMAKAEAVRKAGIMPEENFIYYDDIEWGYKISQAGYRVVVLGASKVWHKCTGPSSMTTFHNYYTWRNRIKFYMRYFDDKEKTADILLNEMFQLVYSCHLKGEDNIIQSVMYAFDDAVHGRFGKAEDYKILPRSRDVARIALALGDAEDVIVRFDGDTGGLDNIIRGIYSNRPDIKVTVAVESSTGDLEKVRQQHPEINAVDVYEPEKYSRHMVMCSHIFKLPEDAQEDIYVDPWCNILYSSDDFRYAKSFSSAKELFILCKKNLLMARFSQQHGAYMR